MTQGNELTPLDEMPPAPAPGDSPTVFSAKAFASLGAWNGFVKQYNLNVLPFNSGVQACIDAAAAAAQSQRIAGEQKELAVIARNNASASADRAFTDANRSTAFAGQSDAARLASQKAQAAAELAQKAAEDASYEANKPINDATLAALKLKADAADVVKKVAVMPQDLSLDDLIDGGGWRYQDNLGTPDGNFGQTFVSAGGGTVGQLYLPLHANNLWIRRINTVNTGSGSRTVWKRLLNHEDVAASALKLQLERTINGVVFNGLTNISVPTDPVFGVGAIGTYALLRPNEAPVGNTAPGSVYAGGSLKYTGTGSDDSSIVPPGSWRAMGILVAGHRTATLFQRVA